MFFVTFHGTINNVYAYDDDGKLHNRKSPNVLDAKGQTLSELRGMYLDPVSGLLYVANGAAATSNVLCFHGSGTSYKYASTFIESPAAGGPKSVIHPYALAFDGAGHCYVSNQDSNVVAAFDVSSDGKSASTLFHESPYVSSLNLGGKYLKGTIVASSIGGLPDVKKLTQHLPPDVPTSKGGLDVEPKQGKVQHSVRGVLTNSGLLYVVDEPGGLVRLYDSSSGQPILNSNPVTAPVQVLIHDGTVYVGAGKQVLSSPIPNPASAIVPPWTLTPIPALSNLPDSVSGMAFDAQGNFHVAIRQKQEVLKFSPDFSSQTPWAANPLGDSPEYLLYIPD
jgi:hypothetical protein